MVDVRDGGGEPGHHAGCHQVHARDAGGDRLQPSHQLRHLRRQADMQRGGCTRQSAGRINSGRGAHARITGVGGHVDAELVRLLPLLVRLGGSRLDVRQVQLGGLKQRQHVAQRAGAVLQREHDLHRPIVHSHGAAGRVRLHHARRDRLALLAVHHACNGRRHTMARAAARHGRRLRAREGVSVSTHRISPPRVTASLARPASDTEAPAASAWRCVHAQPTHRGRERAYPGPGAGPGGQDDAPGGCAHDDESTERSSRPNGAPGTDLANGRASAVVDTSTLTPRHAVSWSLPFGGRW